MVKKKQPHMLFLLALTLIFLLGYFYYFNISPTFVEKPYIEKPTLTSVGEDTITSQHIEYLLNELEAYKLHNTPFTQDKPVIEVYIEDTEQDFFVTVEENKVLISEEELKPDIIITSRKEEIINLFNSNSFDLISDAFLNGDIKIELQNDEKILALKGYKTLYDRISAQNNKLTGNVVVRLNPTGITRGLELLVLVLSSFMTGLVLEKEI